jgi:hypothetical protein
MKWIKFDCVKKKVIKLGFSERFVLEEAYLPHELNELVKNMEALILFK